jgi:hypothetical protein
MRTKYWMILLATSLLACATQAQENLADLVAQAKADWMLGKWEATDDGGRPISFQISWDLDKHVVVFQVKMNEAEFKAYSALDQETRQVTYISFDNHGVINRGSWGLENEELVLRVEGYEAQRGKWKAAAVFTGTPTEGLQVRLHGVDSSGSLVSPARNIYKFKKQK